MARTKSNSSKDSTPTGRDNLDLYPQVICVANYSWNKNEDLRFPALLASNGDLSCSGTQANARGRSGKRARASHWTKVMCQHPNQPPQGNINSAWVHYFIHSGFNTFSTLRDTLLSRNSSMVEVGEIVHHSARQTV
jgi:hypothetical protein